MSSVKKSNLFIESVKKVSKWLHLHIDNGFTALYKETEIDKIYI